jgi:hypothetical protein
MTSVICTKSSSVLSKIIRWAFNEPVSHFAVVMDGKIVFHSNLLGAHLNWWSNFSKHCEVVLRKDLDLTLIQEESVYQSLIQIEGKPYDWSAFFYFIYRGLLLRLFKIPIPETNIQKNDGGFLCVEIAKCFEGIVTLPKDLSIVTPYKLWKASFDYVNIPKP